MEVEDDFELGSISDMTQSEKKTFKDGWVYRDIPNGVAHPEFVGDKTQGEDESPAGKNVRAWETLKNMGFPVVAEKKKVDDNTTMETNVIEGGGCLYDIVSDFFMDNRTKNPLDSKFAKLTKDDFAKAVNPYIELAIKNGVDLPGDGAFHILMKDDGSWNLVMLNIGGIRIFKDPSENQNLANVDTFRGSEWVNSMETIRFKIERSLSVNKFKKIDFT